MLQEKHSKVYVLSKLRSLLKYFSTVIKMQYDYFYDNNNQLRETAIDYLNHRQQHTMHFKQKYLFHVHCAF